MDDVLDARDDSAIVDAFDTACARYPRGWAAAEAVEAVDAPATDDPTRDGGLAMPPPEGFVAPSSTAPTPPPGGVAPAPFGAPVPPAAGLPMMPPAGLPMPPPSANGDFNDLLSSWYYAGYYTGLHEARAEAAARATAPAE